MRVRLLSAIGGLPAYQHGEIVDLEDRVALAWIAAGLAEAAPAAEPALETATADVPETAMRESAKVRGRR